ncbi:TIGR01777 family oxidoreductase [Aestuariibacter sp. A3R04]|uniref:TIGR01777 family oxidoreductase n=1 Tax=Aestuariibacter sp. A3R04 TaxID=2841571 RepID=UPI001C09E4C6|nr:TIGR01777 family oxidoreductase [Aestuariibacter sp. A3R04]MBU3022501.1 TIGR01777 family oxidoreductase [Aestuariibacter sp. A3R04]
MNILLTGGTGLIGTRLIAKLNGESHFTVLSRSPEKARRKLPANVNIISGLHDVPDFCDFDAVVNLAGEPIADKRWTSLQKHRICDSRWALTEQLVERINQCSFPPGVFISGSAIGYYGRQGDKPVTECNFTIHDEFTHTVCSRWENIAMKAASDKVRVCLLRTGVVLDKDRGALPKMALPVKLGVGGKIASGQQYLSWIHIDDMVSGIIHLLHNSKCDGAYNLTAPNPETNGAFTGKLARTLHRPALFTIPAFVLELLMGEAADLVVTGQRVLPERLLEGGFAFQYPTLEQALNNLYPN